MKRFWLKIFFEAVIRLIGKERWATVQENVAFAETFLPSSGEEKKKLVMSKLNWLITDLRKKEESTILGAIATVLIGIAVDAAVAKAKTDK